MTTPPETSRYDIGDLVRLTATFVGTDGITPADPSTVTMLFKNGAGTVATYAGASVARATVGCFYADVTMAVAGSAFYRWVGTGGVQTADEWSLAVAPSFIL